MPSLLIPIIVGAITSVILTYALNTPPRDMNNDFHRGLWVTRDKNGTVLTTSVAGPLFVNPVTKDPIEGIKTYGIEWEMKK